MASLPEGPSGGTSGQSQERAKTFSSLAVRNYRLFFFGQLISVAGTWMQTVAQSFLVLRLTGSGTALGFSIAARFLPILLFGPMGGLIADRRNKRRILLVTQSAAGLLAATFAVVVETHVVTILIVDLLALALGFVNVFDNPARQSFIPEMVPPTHLANAVTLNSVTINLARIFGAALGGLIVAALGIAACFGLNAISFVAVLVSLLAMRVHELYPATREVAQRGQIRAGLRYVWSTPELLIPLGMIAVVGMLAWEFQVTLPLLARFTFHRGAGTYGLFASVMAVGAVIGGVITASRAQPRARTLAIVAIGWGTSILAAAFAPNLPLEFAALLFVGYGGIAFNAMAKTALQLASVPEMRGRVMSLWALAWQGTTPIGGPIVGWVGQELGARWSLIVGGLPTMLAGVIAYRALGRIDARASGRSLLFAESPSDVAVDLTP